MSLSSFIKEWQDAKKNRELEPIHIIAMRLALYPVFICVRYLFAVIILLMWGKDHMYTMLQSTHVD